MSFHPRMYAAVRGFQPLDEMRCLRFDDMVVDYWRVQVQSRAAGRYVSMYPRLVLILDDRALSISRGKHAASGAAAACYIPAGVQVWASLDEPGELKHIDIHLSLPRLKALAGADAPIDRMLVFPSLGPLAPLVRVLQDECVSIRPSLPRVDRLVSAIVQETCLIDRAGLGGGDKGDAWLHTMRAHVFERMEHRIAVDDLAALSGLSRTHFNRVFRKRTAMSPHAWVTGIKIDYAKRLLCRGLPLAEVTNVTGFADQAHFSRSFKLGTGRSPGAWARANTPGPDGPIIQDNPS